MKQVENVTLVMEHLDFSRLVAGELLPFECVAFEKGLMLSSDIENNIG